MGALRPMANACHSRHALRDVDGVALRAPRLPGGDAFLDPEWQASHRLLAAMQARGCVIDHGTVRVLCALVEAWPGPDDGPEAK